MEADDKVINLVHLTYRANNYEALVKEFEFSRATMEAHWNSGYRDAQVTLTNPEIFKLPDRKQGFRIFDVLVAHWNSTDQFFGRGPPVRQGVHLGAPRSVGHDSVAQRAARKPFEAED